MMDKQEIAKVNGLFERIDALETENAKLKSELESSPGSEEILGELVLLKDLLKNKKKLL